MIFEFQRNTKILQQRQQYQDPEEVNESTALVPFLLCKNEWKTFIFVLVI